MTKTTDMLTLGRRDVLKGAAAAGLGFWVGGSLSAAPTSPNERIRFACIGVGGKGRGDTLGCLPHGEVVGLCDVDRGRLADMVRRTDDDGKPLFPDAKTYTDFREMLDELGDTVDAVTVSTPDHTHAVAAATAMKLGKHCFCQKPLTRTVGEARVLGELAREKGVATQMGNQGTAADTLREASEVIRSGALGEITEVHCWTNRPIWPQGIGAPASEGAPPESLDWGSWLGPAADRPYAPGYHPFKWRGFWDFGCGALGDMACHVMNMPYMALGLRDPIWVQADPVEHNAISFPTASRVRYRFAATEARPAVELIWYDGGALPPAELAPSVRFGKNGCLVVGTGGTMFSDHTYGREYRLLPEEKFASFETPEPTIPRSPGHVEEWVRAIRGGEPAMSDFAAYAAPMTEMVVLGNLSVWTKGKRITWDAENLRATGMPELDALIRPAEGNGYSL